MIAMIESDNHIINIIYMFIIFVLPIIGGLSSNIYHRQKNQNWYDNVKFRIPDLVNSNYGIYIGTFIYFFMGIGLIYIGDYYYSLDNNSYMLSNFDKTSINIKSIDAMFNKLRIKNEKSLDKLMLWFIPLVLLLIWISVPIMHQYENLTVAGIFLVIAVFLLMIVLLYMLKISWFISATFFPFFIWNIYNIIFYFLGAEKISSDT